LKFLWGLEVGAWSFRRLAAASAAVAQLALPALARAMRTAKYFAAASFYAVADNFAPAVLAFRRDDCDRAFEAVEDVSLTVFRKLERFVVIVSAQFAFGHSVYLRLFRASATPLQVRAGAAPREKLLNLFRFQNGFCALLAAKSGTTFSA
jgi:hypothetical protein